MIFIDKIMILLNSITSFWCLDNWDQDLFFDNLINSQSSLQIFLMLI